jgi:signal transduction histidine kinase
MLIRERKRRVTVKMRSLFLKIFLWFWLASILIIVSTFVLFSLFEPFTPPREDGRHIRRMSHFGRTAVQVLENDGPTALKNFMSKKRKGRGRGRGQIFLFNEKSREVSGKAPPPHVRELSKKAAKSGVTEFQRHDKRIFLARTIYGSGGGYYIMVGTMPYRSSIPPINRLFNSRFLSFRLLAIFIVASIFCYWLAWYLTAPARKLRTATRQFASGDLKTRVGQQLGGRKDELADLGHDFDIMAERIEELVNAQNRLVGDISHELRSPLARLNVALELARQRAGEEAGGALDRIDRESERLNELIGHLLTLTRLESGSENLKKTTVELDRLVNEVAADADFEAGNRNCKVKVIKSEKIKIKGIEEMLRRAIENVLRNAVRYTREGSVVEISLSLKKAPGQTDAIIAVRDYGPGVPDDQLNNLFRPFYRVDDSRNRQSGGTGIGLAITEKAVRLHGGTVSALNAADGGLIIEIAMPVQI